MKKVIWFALVSTVGMGLATAGLAAQKTIYMDGTPTTESDIIQNRFICVFTERAVTRGQVRSEAVRAAGREGGRVLHDYRNAIRGFSVRISPEGLARMQERNPHIAYCEPDRIVTLGPPPGKGPGSGDGGGETPSEETPWGVQRVYKESSNPSYEVLNYAGSNRAWIIDTGIDLDHPDLNVDTGRSVNFVSKGKDTGPEDLNGHGTHVAGTIAAENDGAGVVGVAPGAPVVAVRVLDRNGSGSWSDVLAGIDHVACHGANDDVANMSLGGTKSDAINQAVEGAAHQSSAADGCVGEGSAKNVKFALAAGNESTDASTKSPASAEGANIYTIAAFSEGDKWASFSNYGKPPIDFAEPGVSIKSTWKDGGYNTISGTSMAAPHAAGLLLFGTINAGGSVTRTAEDSYTIGVHTIGVP